MRKLAFLMMGVAFLVTGLQAQIAPSPLAQGIKLLHYEKNKSALDFFAAEVKKNPTDAETIFWYGQAILAQNYNGIPTAASISEAKTVYQQALQAKGNDAWLLIGMAHIQYLEGADANLIRNNLELAITTSKITSGKNKSKNNPEIMNALGRVFAELPLGKGNNQYAVQKLNDLISEYGEQPLNPNIYMYLGINYLKLGGETAGGEAVVAFKKAAERDPKNAFPYYKIGKIYQSQNNKESFEENYDKALSIDPAIAPVYVSLYNYYSTLDTAKARKNLDLFIQYADKDPSFDYLYADYLFQVAQYDASLAKAIDLKNSIGVDAYPRIAVLLAYNYDRKGDSASARTYIEQFINTQPADKIQSMDYDLAVKVISKFAGAQATVASILERAIAADPKNKKSELRFYKLGYEMFEKANMYEDAAKWFERYATLNGVKDEFYYYKTGSFALNAKNGLAADVAAKGYIAAFPDKSRGYVFNIQAAALLDTGAVKNLYLEALTLNSTFLLKDIENNKQKLIDNFSQMLRYFNEIKAFDKAVEMCDEILKLAPGNADMLKYRDIFQKNADILKGVKKAADKPATDKPTDKPAADKSGAPKETVKPQVKETKPPVKKN
jgi:tetratricopeptide (TPR) repeat protein